MDYCFRQRGFTLLEVLVALAILAIAMGALIKVGSEGANNISRLRDQTLAGWVGLNQINTVLMAGSFPPEGTTNGTATMANREWYWEMEITTTANEDMRRLDINVHLDNEDGPRLARLSAFKGQL